MEEQWIDGLNGKQTLRIGVLCGLIFYRKGLRGAKEGEVEEHWIDGLNGKQTLRLGVLWL